MNPIDKRDLQEIELQHGRYCDRINDAVIASIKSGRASKWVSGRVYKSARRYMAFKNAGLNAATADRLAARARMKKYRETHKLIWQ